MKKKGGFGKTGKATARQERFKGESSRCFQIRSFSKLIVRLNRLTANIELQHQVRESISALSAESSARVERFEEEHRLTAQFGLPPSLDNLTEEEAIAFAMILSAEEEEKKLIALAMDNGKGREDEYDGEESDGDWEQPTDDWLADDGVMLDEDYDERPSGSGLRRPSTIVVDDYEETAQQGGSQSQSLSTSLNVPSSPYLRGSPSPSPRSFSAYNHWKPASAASSPSLSAFGSPTSNAKLQVSPRLGPTYGSSFSNYANDPVPDMDPTLWPTAASTSTSPPPSSRKSSFASPSPSPSPSSSSFPISPPLTKNVSSASTGTSTPARRGWSQVARASPSPSTNSSPSALRPVSTAPPISPWGSKPPSSLLSDQLRASTNSSRNEEEEERRRRREEEDLQYAIELSMVEEASKLEI